MDLKEKELDRVEFIGPISGRIRGNKLELFVQVNAHNNITAL